MHPEIEEMSLAELQEQLEAIQRRMAELKQEKIKEVKRQILDLAASIGETPASLFGLGQQSKPKRPKAPPKYRHPDDASLTWSGRGMAPRWLRALEEAGHDRAEYLIEKPLI